jgi:hypothetical protein
MSLIGRFSATTDDPAVEIRDKDANDVGVDQAPNLRFALPQCLLSPLAFRQVDADGDNLYKLSACREHRIVSCFDVLDCSIGQYDSEFVRIASLFAHCVLEVFVRRSDCLWGAAPNASVARLRVLTALAVPSGQASAQFSRATMLSCQLRSNRRSIVESRKKIEIPSAESRRSAANIRAMFSRFPDSTMRQPRPVLEPDPATNSAMTAPINAKPLEIFLRKPVNEQQLKRCL